MLEIISCYPLHVSFVMRFTSIHLNEYVYSDGWHFFFYAFKLTMDKSVMLMEYSGNVGVMIAIIHP